MALSRITATGDGSTTQFALNFPLGILSRSHVTCRVGSEVDGLGAPVYRELTWLHGGLVQVGGAIPESGVSIVFDRTVPVEALYHDYVDGTPISDENLNESNKQTLMAIHQVLDGKFSAFAKDTSMGNHRLTNVANAVDAQDAVTLSQMTAMTGNAPAYAAAAAASAVSAAGYATAASASAIASDVAADRAELAAASIPLSKYNATTNPTVNDDANDGYGVGSEWWNTATGGRFGCTSPAVGAAVWVSLSTDLSGLGSAAYEDTSFFATAAQGALADTALQPSDSIRNPIMHVQHRTSSGVNAGTFSAGAWRTRELNTVIANTIAGASLAGDQITLPAGTYIVRGHAPAASVDRHQARLYCVSVSAIYITGSSELAQDTTPTVTRSVFEGEITIPAPRTFEVQHRCTVSRSSDGLGKAAGFGTEVYTHVFIEKVA